MRNKARKGVLGGGTLPFFNNLCRRRDFLPCHEWQGFHPVDMMTEWIKFVDKQPRKGQHILVWSKNICRPTDIVWGTGNPLAEILVGPLELLTHWTHLPEPPEEAT